EESLRREAQCFKHVLGSLPCPSRSSREVSDAEILVEFRFAGSEFAALDLVDDTPLFDYEVTIGDFAYKAQILLHQYDVEVHLLQLAHRHRNLVDDDWRQPLGRFVEQ